MLVTLEGVDGCGKTTVHNSLTDYYDYEEILLTREPRFSNTEKLFSQNETAIGDFFAYLWDRVNHIDSRIIPAMERGKLIVSDRYADSTRAYQPVALVNDGVFTTQAEARKFVDSAMKPWLLEPDAVIWIDAEPSVAVERSHKKHEYERLDFLCDVHQNYRKLYQERDNIYKVDGHQSEDDVLEDCLSIINGFHEAD